MNTQLNSVNRIILNTEMDGTHVEKRQLQRKKTYLKLEPRGSSNEGQSKNN